jgi:hypothetical protein
VATGIASNRFKAPLGHLPNAALGTGRTQATLPHTSCDVLRSLPSLACAQRAVQHQGFSRAHRLRLRFKTCSMRPKRQHILLSVCIHSQAVAGGEASTNIGPPAGLSCTTVTMGPVAVARRACQGRDAGAAPNRILRAQASPQSRAASCPKTWEWPALLRILRQYSAPCGGLSMVSSDYTAAPSPARKQGCCL